MKLWALMFLLLSTQFAFSQEEDCEEDGSSKLVAAVMKQSKAEEASNCPDKKKFKNLCMMVSGRSEDNSGDSKHRYLYQRKILEGSCVNVSNDSEKVRNEKIQNAWSKLEKELVCNNLQFDVQNGSIIKYAVSSNFDAFINDVVNWKVNLNKVDETDQRTVLDYIKYQIEKTKGSETAKKLKNYYDQLRKAGAKHKSEL